jgi:hypothetical protein
VIEDAIVISRTEYDWLVDRSHRLEQYEPGRG